MITQREISIGNYFIHNDNFNYANHNGIFQWSDGDWFALGECTLFLENIHPILLTEEILLNLGFFKVKDKEHEYEGSRFTIFKPVEYIGYLFCEGNTVLRELKYLHSLQNLYFALTGHELELKKPLQS